MRKIDRHQPSCHDGRAFRQHRVHTMTEIPLAAPPLPPRAHPPPSSAAGRVGLSRTPLLPPPPPPPWRPPPRRCSTPAPRHPEPKQRKGADFEIKCKNTTATAAGVVARARAAYRVSKERAAVPTNNTSLVFKLSPLVYPGLYV